MNNTYKDLIQQNYPFPQEGFDLVDGYLSFYGVSIQKLIEKHGTPFKLLYLPRIGQQIDKARYLFQSAIEKHEYKGTYEYSYCTKCSHFAHVIKTALKKNVHLETSSSFDIDLIEKLYAEKQLTLDTTLIHNGHKTRDYLLKILNLNKLGFKNSVIVLDSLSELSKVKMLAENYDGILKIGIRIAIDEEPQSAYYTSRLGIRPSEILPFYRKEIENETRLSLEMVHFYVDSGIKDSLYYWGEFNKALAIYIKLKKHSPSLSSFNLGGGFPIRNKMSFEYDYKNIIEQIVGKIKSSCSEANILEPNIFTEFGKYTVGESGAIIFEVLEQKKQNDQELWYLVNNSLMNTIPDAWSIHEKFILLPINKWQNNYTKVSIGGISCDHSDYYNSEDFNQHIILPRFKDSDTHPLYIGFFHTGAYQDSISGYGGIKHCLIPSPKLILINQDDEGRITDHLYRNEQTVEDMLSILGYI